MFEVGKMADLTGRGPLGQKKPKAERGTVKAREHLSRVKQLPCVICRKHGPSDAHHVFCGRFGSSKASDFEVIPLCKAHHQEGPDAIHNCKASWVEKYGEDHKYLPLVDQWLRSI